MGFIRHWCDGFRTDSRGSVAVEFALLVVPFLALIFASFDSVLTSVAEYRLIKEANVVVRELMTGQITKSDASGVQSKICKRLGTLFDCSMVSGKQNFFVDLRHSTDGVVYDRLNKIPLELLVKRTDPRSQKQKFQFDPGGPGTINVLRIYYRWEMKLELVRPFMSGVGQDENGNNFTYVMMVNEVFRMPSDG